MGGRVPPGIKLVRYVLGRAGREHQHIKTYQLMVLVLTFIAYACYHASRKPPSIVKSVLDPEPLGSVSSSPPWPVGEVFVRRCNDSEEGDGVLKRKWKKGWAPFDGPDGTAKLGEIDLAFLAFYAIGMYVAGHLGDVFDLRVFLAVGMIASGGFVGLFGMGYFWNVHWFSYYLMAQMLAGLFQSTGWPSVVAVVGNWFGERKRGLIMGVWNAHTSVGNICGSLLAASVLQHGWGWSFTLPAAVIIGGGILVYLFLVAYPEDIGFTKPKRKRECVKRDEEIGNLNGVEGGNLGGVEGGNLGGGVDGGKKEGGRKGSAVGFKEACLIPGVIPFALCLFFSKLVAYTFLYWLPFYLSQTEIGGEYMSVKSAGNLSTLFDVGGIVGGILAGYISDQLNARALTASFFMYLAIPAMYFYNRYGGISQFTNILLMMIAGLFVNGPYALITTAVSADLGTHSSLKGDSRALATVTSIIDATGSVGAALGPLLTGFISLKGWELVFIMLMIGAFVAGIMLISLVRIEVLQLMSRWKDPSPSSCNPINGDSYSEPLLRQNTR